MNLEHFFGTKTGAEVEAIAARALAELTAEEAVRVVLRWARDEGMLDELAAEAEEASDVWPARLDERIEP